MAYSLYKVLIPNWFIIGDRFSICSKATFSSSMLWQNAAVSSPLKPCKRPHMSIPARDKRFFNVPNGLPQGLSSIGVIQPQYVSHNYHCLEFFRRTFQKILPDAAAPCA
jgi:hypothetical protein